MVFLKGAFKRPKKQALKLYDQSKSVAKVIQLLSYPTRKALYKWIATRDDPPKKRWNETSNHLRHPSFKIKMNTIDRCFELGENVKLVSEEIEYNVQRDKYSLQLLLKSLKLSRSSYYY